MSPKQAQFHLLSVMTISTLFYVPSSGSVDVCSAISNPDCRCINTLASPASVPYITCTFTASTAPSPLFKSSIAEIAKIGTLNISGNGLQTLPENFFTNETVHTLVLMNNNFKSIPAALAKIRGLRVLDLSSNELNFVDWGVLKALSDLEKLDLSSNRLTNLAFDYSMENDALLLELKELNLAWNVISSINGSVFNSMKGLRTLDLSNNQLQQVTQTMFHELKQTLMTLELSNNVLRQVHYQAFQPLHGLRHLSLTGNRLKDVTSWSLPQHLRSLDLNDCALTSVNYCQLSALEDLNFLGLRGNDLNCSCELFLVLKWYENGHQNRGSSSETGSQDNDWTCRGETLAPASRGPSETTVSSGAGLTTNAVLGSPAMTKTTASGAIGFLPVTDARDVMTQCRGFDIGCDTEQDGQRRLNGSTEIEVSLEVESSGDSIEATWTFKVEYETEIDGFQLLYLPEGGQLIKSDVIPADQRSTVMKTSGLEDHYMVCLDVLKYGSAVIYQQCQGVQDTFGNVVVGILAGVIFLVPCVMAMLYVIFKDRKIAKDTEYEPVGIIEKEEEIQVSEKVHCVFIVEDEAETKPVKSTPSETTEPQSNHPSGDPRTTVNQEQKPQLPSSTGTSNQAARVCAGLNGSGPTSQPKPSSVQVISSHTGDSGYSNPAYVCDTTHAGRDCQDPQLESSRL